MSFTTFSFPTPTLFGAGALAELPARLAPLGIQRPLIVTDPGVLAAEAFDRLQTTLGPARQGHHWFLFSGVHSNPVEQDVVEAAQAYRGGPCDAVIAFGGSSPLDVGKAACLLVKRPGFKLRDFCAESDWSGLAPLARKSHTRTSERISGLWQNRALIEGRT